MCFLRLKPVEKPLNADCIRNKLYSAHLETQAEQKPLSFNQDLQTSRTVLAEKRSSPSFLLAVSMK